MFSAAHKNSTTSRNPSLFNSGSSTSFIQPKLDVGKPGDKYEVEADKAADQIVAKSNESSAPFFPATPTIQKQSEEDVQKQDTQETEIQQQPVVDPITPGVQLKENNNIQKAEEEEIQQQEESDQGGEELQMMVNEESVQQMPENTLQTKESSDITPTLPTIQKMAIEDVQRMEDEEVQEKEEEEIQTLQKQGSGDEGNTSSIENNLNNSKGGGSPLDTNTKGEMESGFGANFSDVRVHNDSNAVQMNQQLGAQAFTSGNDIYFNEGKYSPESNSGKHLLAHELTHTVQQGASSTETTQAKIQSNPSAPQIQKQDGGDDDGDQNGQQNNQQGKQQNQNNDQQQGNQNNNQNNNQNTGNGQNQGNNNNNNQSNQQNNQNPNNPSTGNNQQQPNTNDSQSNNSNQSNQNVNGDNTNGNNTNVPNNNSNPQQGNQQGVAGGTQQQGGQRDGGAAGGPVAFPTFEAFTAFVAQRKQVVESFYREKNTAIDTFIRVERERAINQVNAEIRRLRETKTSVIGSIDRTFRTVETAINTKRNTEIENARKTAETELKRINTITTEKQKLIKDKGESKAQAVITGGNEQANIANNSTNEKVRGVDTVIRRKSSQYRNNDNADKVTESAWDSKADTVAKIRESGRAISDSVTEHARDLAKNYRDDSASIARKFTESKNEARSKVIENRDETITALRDSGVEAVDGLRTETNNLKTEVNTGITQQITSLSGLPERITEELYDVEIHVKAKLREDERNSLADIDKFSKEIGKIYWHRDEVTEAQQDLEQAITDQENDVTTFVTESNTRLTTGVTAFITELVNTQNRVIPTFTQIGTDYNTAATQVQTDTVNAIDEVARNSEMGARSVGDELDTGLQDQVNEEETRWDHQLDEDVRDMRERVSEGIQQQEEILDRFEDNLDSEFNKGDDFWSFVRGVFQGFWDGFTGLLSVLWEAMGTLLFWIIILIIVIIIVLLVVFTTVTLALIGKVLLIIGLIVGVIAFLYFLIAAIVTQGLTPYERGRLLGRGLFELAFALIGTGVYARLMGWIPRISRLVAIVSRIPRFAIFLRLVLRAKDLKALIRIIDTVQDLATLLRILFRTGFIDDMIRMLDKADDINRLIRVLGAVDDLDGLFLLLKNADDIGQILTFMERAIALGKGNALVRMLSETAELTKLLQVLAKSGDEFAAVLRVLEDAPDLNKMVIALTKSIDDIPRFIALMGREGMDVSTFVKLVTDVTDLKGLFKVLEDATELQKALRILDEVTEVNKLIKVLNNADDLNRVLRIFDGVTEMNKLVTILDRTSELNKLLDFLESVGDIEKAITALEALGSKLDDFVALVDVTKGFTPDKLLAVLDKITDVDKIARILPKVADIDILIVVLGRIDASDMGKFVSYLLKVKNEASMTKFLGHFNVASDPGILLQLFDAHGSTSKFLKLLDNISDINILINVAKNLPNSSHFSDLIKGMKVFTNELDDFITFLNAANVSDLADLVHISSLMKGTSLIDFKALVGLADNVAQLRTMMSFTNMTGTKLLSYFTKAGAVPGVSIGSDLLALLRRADHLGDITRVEQFLNKAAGNLAEFQRLLTWFNRFPWPPGAVAANYTDATTSMQVMMDHICGRHTVEAFHWITANTLADTTLFQNGAAWSNVGQVRTLLDNVLTYLHTNSLMPIAHMTDVTFTYNTVSYTLGVRLEAGALVVGQFFKNGGTHLTAQELQALMRLFAP